MDGGSLGNGHGWLPGTGMVRSQVNPRLQARRPDEWILDRQVPGRAHAPRNGSGPTTRSEPASADSTSTGGGTETPISGTDATGSAPNDLPSAALVGFLERAQRAERRVAMVERRVAASARRTSELVRR